MFGTSRSIQTRNDRFNNQFILDCSYISYICLFLVYFCLSRRRPLFPFNGTTLRVSSKNFAKVLLLFQIPKDTVFSYAGAPLSNVRVAFLKTLLFSARQFLCLSTPLCLLYLQIIKNGLLLMKLQCKGSTKKRSNENLDRNSAKIREESNGNQMAIK